MLTVPAGRRNLMIQYTSLDLRQSSRTTFRVKLEGFDADWASTADRRVASYTNLPPGHYRFLAAAAVAGRSGPVNTLVAFDVEPFFHETTVFRGALAAGIVLLGLGAVRLRARHLRRRAIELEQVLDSRTQELRERSASVAAPRSS